MGLIVKDTASPHCVPGFAGCRGPTGRKDTVPFAHGLAQSGEKRAFEECGAVTYMEHPEIALDAVRAGGPPNSERNGGQEEEEPRSGWQGGGTI